MAQPAAYLYRTRPECEVRRPRFLPIWPKVSFTVVRRLVGALLLIAAALKGLQFLKGGGAYLIDLPNWFVALPIALEAILGIWMCVGKSQKAIRAVALMVFGAFATYTALKSLHGEPSCGCFGAVGVTPFASLTIDVLAIGLLFASIRHSPQTQNYLLANSWQNKSVNGFRYLGGTCCVTIGILGGSAISSIAATDSRSDVQIFEADEWVGKQLPFLDDIDIANQISIGDWTVLLFHHDCSKCSKAIAEIQRKISTVQRFSNPSGESVAFVEMPPYGEASPEIYISAIIGHVQPTSKWSVKTPSVLHILNGVVQSVETGS